jgi:hypothetical protein
MAGLNAWIGCRIFEFMMSTRASLALLILGLFLILPASRSYGTECVAPKLKPIRHVCGIVVDDRAELGARPKVAGEAQSRVSRNGAGTMQDTHYPVGGYPNVAGQLRGGDSQGSDGAAQVFPGMDSSAQHDSPQSW